MGIRGAVGARGARGESGAIGAAGQRGDAGPAGEPGPRGETGAAGSRGRRGGKGPPGEPGACGCPGYGGPEVVPAVLEAQEVFLQLDIIIKGVAFYFTKPRIDALGNKLPCAFPPSTPWTPSGSPCDDGAGHYTADPDVWAAAGWKDVSFQILRDHAFRYRYETSADGLSIEVYGAADLDCDGEWSSYKRTLSGYELEGECTLAGSTAVESLNPTE